MFSNIIDRVGRQTSNVKRQKKKRKKKTNKKE